MNISPFFLFHLAVSHSYFSNDSALPVLKIGPLLGDNLPGIGQRAMAEKLGFFSQQVSPKVFDQPILVPIYSSDPLFFNYTELGLEYDRTKYSNIKVDETFPHQVVCLQSSKAPDKVLKADMTTTFPVHSGHLMVRFEKKEKGQEEQIEPVYEALTKLELKDEELGVSLIVPPEPNAPCTINLPSGVNGIFHLSATWLDGTNETYTFFALSHSLPAPPLAILCLYPEQLVDIPENGDPSFLQPSYTVLFQPQAVIFRYFLIAGTDDISLDGAQITLKGDNAPDTSFEQTDPSYKLPDGRTAVVFSSGKQFPINLEERATYRVHLALPDARFSGMVLPFPEASNVRLSADGPFYGDVYVYI